MKQARPQARHKPSSRKKSSIGFIDQAGNCCRNITTLARLLNATVPERAGELVRADVIAHAGAMIADEVDQLSEVLEAIHQKLAMSSIER